MNLDDRFNVVPPCLRGDAARTTERLDSCVLGSISFYIELLLILIAIAAFFYLVVAGIKMATAFGNEAKYTEAKNTITHAVIGIIIATLAYTIVSFVTGFFGVTGPRIYDEQGQSTTNSSADDPADDAEVTPLVWAGRFSGSDSQTSLTDDQFNSANGGSAGGSVSVPGGQTQIILLDRRSFSARLVRTVNGKPQEETLTTRRQVKNGDEYFWVRDVDTATSYKGAYILIQQKQEDGSVKTRKVSISAP